MRYHLQKYPRPHTRIPRQLYVDYACEFLADASNHPVPIMRNRGLAVQKTAAKYSRNLTDQRGREERGVVRGFMRSRHLRVGVVGSTA